MTAPLFLATCSLSQCYYLDPIKKSVSQPFSLGLPKLKVCQRLMKQNPEICQVRNRRHPTKLRERTEVSPTAQVSVLLRALSFQKRETKC